MTRITFLIAAAVAAAIPAIASAQSAIELGERPIRRAEVIAFVDRQFKQMDSNRDGSVSRAEFEAYRAQQGDRSATGIGHIGSRWFDKTDADGNGRVTLEEARARPLKMFDMADVNGDGVLSVEEQQMAMLFMGK